jgi:hypothetical protein
VIALALAVLLATSPAADAPLTLGDAEALLWAGRLAEAEAALEPLASDGDPSALVRLSQARRWSGRPLGAREAALRALAVAPRRGDVREEVAWTWVEEGRAASALEVLGGDPAGASNELLARIRALRRASASVGGTAYSDNHGVVRLAPRLRIDVPWGPDARLSLGGGGTRLSQDGTAGWSESAGAELAFPLGRVELGGGAGIHRVGGELLTEGHAGLVFRPSDALRLDLLARRRPFVEGSLILTTEMDAFHEAGAGGAVDITALERRGVDELRLGVAAQPFGGTWVYAVGRAFLTSDRNSGWSAALGAGASLTRILRARGPIEATLRWDSYLTGFSELRAAYLSPPYLDVHSPGLEVTLRAGDALALSVEGGPAFTTEVAAPDGFGWFAGAGVEVALGRAKLGLRAQARRNPWFESARAWTRLHFPF